MDKEKKYKNVTTTIPIEIYEKIKQMDIPISKLILMGYEVATKQKKENEDIKELLIKIYSKLLDIEELLKKPKS
jgi:post-segregation antitoxin (ccd killing protein)